MAQQISESELVLMKIIWKNGGAALYSLIMEELEKDKNEWKNNTVLTLLSRLGEKISSFLDKVYGGNVKNLVSTLLRQDILSADELKEIETFWRKENE